MTSSEEFLNKYGMSPDSVDIVKCTDLFIKEMKQGLASPEHGLPMLPTYLSIEGKIRTGEPVAVIDAGGTHLRTGLVEFTEYGYNISQIRNEKMPGTPDAITWPEFISIVADQIEPLMDDAQYIGFCFSYKADIVPGIDGTNVEFTKQIRITGSEGHFVCADLIEELQKRNHYCKQAVILNDSVAVVMEGIATMDRSDYSGFVGLVVGTGINSCGLIPVKKIKKIEEQIEADEMIVNYETGYLTKLPCGDLDRNFWCSTKDPSKGWYEKMTSGGYIGNLIRSVLAQACEDGYLSRKFLNQGYMDTAIADRWCNGEGLKEVAETQEDADFIQEVSCALFKRAAKFVTANLCACMELADIGGRRPACICAEGTMYHRSAYFRNQLEQYMNKYAADRMHYSYKFHTSEDTNFVGAAAAALLNITD